MALLLVGGFVFGGGGGGAGFYAGGKCSIALRPEAAGSFGGEVWWILFRGRGWLIEHFDKLPDKSGQAVYHLSHPRFGFDQLLVAWLLGLLNLLF
ncbi:MAG: hypothetical protein U0176_12015 [Bacteroidia bacterium]